MVTTTINGNDEWEYLGVLNVCIKILLTVIAGACFGRYRVFRATVVPHFVKFVYFVALPSLVVNGLGINLDLYDDDLVWKFVNTFLITRAIALVVSIAVVARSKQSKSVGQVAVLWLAQTWISTVILGVPISSAVFKNPAIGVKYGIMAAISSFIFQLPFQLFILECHRLQELSEEESNETNGVDVESIPSQENVQKEVSKVDTVAHGDNPNDEDVVFLHSKPNNRPLVLHAVYQKHMWRNIGVQILKNPVIWGIAIGFFLTLSTLGPTYLKKGSDNYIPGLGWLPETLKWLGDTVSPMSLFSMGLWMEDQGAAIFQLSLLEAAGFMFAKLVLTPLIVLGLAIGFNLDDVPGRAAVLIASLPISMTSFSLGERYRIGEAVLSENVALGTLLVLPTILVWNMILDAIGVFPIPE